MTRAKDYGPEQSARDFISWCKSEGIGVDSLPFPQALALTLANARRSSETETLSTHQNLSLSDPDVATILTAMGDRVESVTTVLAVANREHTTIIRFRDPRADRGEG